MRVILSIWFFYQGSCGEVHTVGKVEKIKMKILCARTDRKGSFFDNPFDLHSI